MCLCEQLFYCKTIADLPITCDAIESLCLKILNEKLQKIILRLTYRPPNGDVKRIWKTLK